MGLFLKPFSGYAVGGGGHGNIDPPPPGSDPGSGPRAEVDTVGRSPLRLLRTTMNKHKPKFLKVVPPGQQRGVMAPPYTWDTLERSDWSYESPKRPKLGMGEGEFDSQKPPRPHPIGPSNHPSSGGAAQATAPRPKPAMPQNNAAVDARRRRVDQIHAELKQLHQDVQQLLMRQKAAVSQGKQQVATTAKQFAPRLESLTRSDLRIKEANDYTPIGIDRRTGDAPRPGWHLNPHDTPLPMPTDAERREIMQARNLRSRGIPTGLSNQPPKASNEVIGIHKEIQQKRARIQQLTQELRQLRQQAHESIGFNVNNLSRQSLLLK